MCGLVGVMGDINQDEKAVFNQLLVVDVLRGKHSTGAALISHSGHTKVFKKAVNSMDFLDFSTYKDHMRTSYNCMIGHNRHATKGAVNNVNAHPFDFDNVVGAHNGTLRAYHNLDDARDFEVDSECLYSHINDNGIQDAFNKVSGALALTWFDKKTNKLHFLRNSERPMAYCYRKDMGTLFWASEPWMLRGVLARNGIPHTDVVITTEDVLYSFDMPTMYSTKNTMLSPPKVHKLVKPTVAKKSVASSVNSGKSLTVTSNYNNYSKYLNTTVEVCISGDELDVHNAPYIEGFLANDTNIDVRFYAAFGGPVWNQLLDKMDKGNFKCKVSGLSGFNTKHSYLRADLRSISYAGDIYCDKGEVDSSDVPTVEGFQGKKLNCIEFHEHASKGCAWCADIGVFSEPVVWVANKEFVCGVCQQQPEVMEWINESFGGQS